MTKTGADRLREWALGFIGEEYQWGEVPQPYDSHKDKDPRDGDCSGACYAWWRWGGVPNKVLGGRQTADDYSRMGVAVAPQHMVCGDYIVLQTGTRAHHIIMCIGKGQTMEAKGEKYGYVRSTVDKCMTRAGAHAKRMPKIHGYLGDLTGADRKPSRLSHPVWPNRYLHLGLRDRDHRGAIRLFQNRLRDRDWRHMVVNGTFDATTEKIVTQFQRQKRLEVDGVVGPLTWNAFWEAPITDA